MPEHKQDILDKSKVSCAKDLTTKIGVHIRSWSVLCPWVWKLECAVSVGVEAEVGCVCGCGMIPRTHQKLKCAVTVGVEAEVCCGMKCAVSVGVG